MLVQFSQKIVPHLFFNFLQKSFTFRFVFAISIFFLICRVSHFKAAKYFPTQFSGPFTKVTSRQKESSLRLIFNTNTLEEAFAYLLF